MATVDCPKCQAVNPDTSRFCGLCAAPLVPPGRTASTPSARPEADPGAYSGAPQTPPPYSSRTPTPSESPSGSPSLTTTIDPVARGLLPGAVVAGKYRILGEIGRGGMGVVYEADDVKLRRAVALKFLPLELTDDDEARERFVHEAQAASVLDNPHICTIHEIGEGEDRRMFIAMALCHGESLRAKIKRGPLPAAEALSFAAQVADGLAAAHAHGIVHRDVKPANILVSQEGIARVADFGLAKIAGEARLTREGRAVGTVAYMSPEQLRGEDVDARTDVWSLGVVLYEMLTGALPFHGTNEHSLAYAIVNSDPKPLSSLPPGTPDGCVRVLERALAKDVAERFATAGEMAEAIAGVRAEAGFSGNPRSSSRAARPPVRRPALVRIGLPLLTLAVIASVAIALRLPRKAGLLLGLIQPPSKAITFFTPAVLGENEPDRILAAGLAEYLRLRIDEIARRSRSWVTPGDDLHAYDVREASQARRILGSNIVVTGALRRAGDNISLTLDFIDTARLSRLASVPKSDHIANIATWQDDLVRETAAALDLPAAPASTWSRPGPASASSSSASSSAAGTTVPTAFEAYIRGLGLLTSADPGPGAGAPVYAAALDASISALEEACRLDPSFASAGIELAEAWRLKSTLGNDPSAAARAETDARAALRTRDDIARGHYVLGRILRRLNRDDEAAAELERAVALDPFFYDALIRLAMLFDDRGEPAKAEAAYRAALRIRPGYWAGGAYLGIFYFYQGATDKALDELDRVVRACPDNIIALNDLGAVLFKRGEYDKAIRAFESSNAIKRNPDACSNLGVLYYYSGRYAESVNQNEAAIAFGLSDFSNLIWGNLADAYHFTPGNQAKAEEAYRKAIAFTRQTLAADPANYRARASLAVHLAKAGEADEARAEIAAALKAKPGDADIVLHAVFVHEVVGARPEALDAVREYVELKGPMDEIMRDPFLAGLRQDPGFADITRK